MYCQKCGAGVPDKAKRCPQCKAPCKKTKSPLIGGLLCLIGILLIAIGITLIFLFVVLPKGFGKSNKDLTSTSTSVSISASASISEENTDIDDDITEPEVEDSEKESIIEKILNKDEDKDKKEFNPLSDSLQLPSLESFSEDRMIEGVQEEYQPGSGIYMLTFKAMDSSIVECMSEYSELLKNSYGFTDAGSTSYTTKNGYNCTYYAFNLDDSTTYKLENIEVRLGNEPVTATIIFEKGRKDDEAYIKVFMPEGVTFYYDETIYKRNGY